MNSLSFLEQCPPPWVAFPQIAPDTLAVHLRQGVAEPWFDQTWRPFWGCLTSAQQALYLAHWEATPEWREALFFFFSADGSADDVADVEDSERLLRQNRAVAARPRPSWLLRLFGRTR